MHSTASEIVRYLRASRDFVSGQEIADRLGMTRAAVWKHIRALRITGFEISSVTNRGYRLDSVPDLPSEEVLYSLLNTSRFGKTIEYHSVTPSTNSRAMSLGHQGAAEGTVVTADSQTAGKARGGGTWESPSGKNLYISVLLKPGISTEFVFQLDRLALNALAVTVGEFCPALQLSLEETGLFSEGGKVGGVLCEVCGEIGNIHHAVVGFGLNVTHHAKVPGSVSILELTGKTLSRAELTVSVLEHFENSYLEWTNHEKI